MSDVNLFLLFFAEEVKKPKIWWGSLFLIARCGGINLVCKTPISKKTMTYEKIFKLKFKKGCSTQELMQRFPKQVEKVREIALFEVPDTLLKKLVSQDDFSKIVSLKQKFLKSSHPVLGKINFSFPEKHLPA